MPKLKIVKNKVLVTGANGLLGQRLVAELHGDFEVYGIGRGSHAVAHYPHYTYSVCDITRRSDVVALVKKLEPHYIVNAAAYTNVDGCEDEKETCWKVNVNGVENLAQSARKVHATLIQVSSDYIFDGANGPYDEESKPKPLGYYGRAKLASENAVIAAGIEHAIVRTMVLYGAGEQVRPNFATWLIDKLSQGEHVNIVDDQYGHPTLVDDLARAIKKLIELNKRGIYHVVGSECLSRYDFALKLADVFDLDSNLISRIKTEELQQKAPRPLNSQFNIDKAKQELGIEMSDAETGLNILKRQLQKDRT